MISLDILSMCPFQLFFPTLSINNCSLILLSFNIPFLIQVLPATCLRYSSLLLLFYSQFWMLSPSFKPHIIGKYSRQFYILQFWCLCLFPSYLLHFLLFICYSFFKTYFVFLDVFKLFVKLVPKYLHSLTYEPFYPLISVQFSVCSSIPTYVTLLLIIFNHHFLFQTLTPSLHNFFRFILFICLYLLYLFSRMTTHTLGCGGFIN